MAPDEDAEIQRRINATPIKKVFTLEVPAYTDDEIQAWLKEAREQIIRMCGIPNANS